MPFNAAATNVSGVLYFTAEDSTHGSELWRSRRAPAPKHSGEGSPPRNRWLAGGSGVLAVNPDHHDYPALLVGQALTDIDRSIVHRTRTCSGL